MQDWKKKQVTISWLVANKEEINKFGSEQENSDIQVLSETKFPASTVGATRYKFEDHV